MKTHDPERPHGQSLAFVVFAPSSLSYLRILKTGYQHCMVLVQHRGEWMLLNPLSNGLRITHMGLMHPAELIRYFSVGGLSIVAVQRAAPRLRELPWAPFTCVEFVKRVLAIDARWVMTPWQLNRWIQRRADAARDGDLRHTAGNR